MPSGHWKPSGISWLSLWNVFGLLDSVFSTSVLQQPCLTICLTYVLQMKSFPLNFSSNVSFFCITIDQIFKGQNSPFPVKWLLEAKILHIYIILHEEFGWSIYFCQPTCFDLFWGPLGVNDEQKVQKFPIPLQMTPRTWKFAQWYNFWSQFLYCCSFRTNHKFWLFLGHPRSLKGSKIVHFFKSNSPEAVNLYREIRYSHKSVTVTHLGQIRNSYLFGGHLGVKCRPKIVKNCLSR